jgi:hypothetical protein
MQKKTDGNYSFAEIEVESYSKSAGALQKSTESIKTLTGKNFIVHKTKGFEIFQDSKYCFTVIHATKEIYWLPPQKLDGKTDNEYIAPKDLNALRIKMIETSEVSFLGDTLVGSDTLKVLLLRVSPQLKSLVNMESIKYYLIENKNQMWRTVTLYKPGYKFAYQIITFIKTDEDYRDVGETEAKRYVFDNKNVLLPKYAGYELKKMTTN